MQEAQEIWVRSLGWEDPLEEEIATCSSILARKIQGTEEPGRLQSMGSQELDMPEHVWAREFIGKKNELLVGKWEDVTVEKGKPMKTVLSTPLLLRSRELHPSPEEETLVQFSSVAQSCLTLCDPMNRSTPGLPVHHQLPEFTQTHLHRVSDAIQPSHPRSSPSPPVPQSLPPSESFPVSQLFTWGVQSTGVSASASVLSVNIQGWFPLTLTGLISLLSKGLSQESSPAPHFKSINSSGLSLLCGPTLTSIYDCWKNHSFDYGWTFVGNVISLLFNMLSRLVIAFLPISWLQSPPAVILEPSK